MKKLVLAALAATTVLCAAPASAAVTFYTNAGAFQAALASHSLENFNNPTLAPGLTIVSTNGNINGGVFNDQLTGSNAVRTTFNFATGQNGFGGLFDLTPGGAGLGIEIRLVGSGGLLMQEVPNSASGQFFGFISDQAFTEVRFTGGTQAGAGAIETYTLDNLRFGVTAAVPEPATWAMMMLGFGAMGSVLRRRQKVSARIRFA